MKAEKLLTPELMAKLRFKAEQSPSNYRLSGIALNKKGEVLGCARNGFRKNNLAPGKYAGRHVEQALIERYGDNIKTIIIMRIGNGGDCRPIDPCEKCARLAEKMGIKIISVAGE